MIKEDYSISVNPKMLGSVSPLEIEKLGILGKLKVPTDTRLQPNPKYLRSRIKMFGMSRAPRKK